MIGQHGLRRIVLACALVLAGAPATEARAQDGAGDGAAAMQIGPSGLPVPRFVSLKSDRVNLRKGPSTQHPVVWQYRKAGLPVEVIAEYENWRQVRDSDGADGWVFHSLLSGRRTALVSPWSKEPEPVALYERRSADAEVVARLQSGVLGSVLGCDGAWCRFSIDRYTGWIRQETLWGVYRGETVE